MIFFLMFCIFSYNKIISLSTDVVEKKYFNNVWQSNAGHVKLIINFESSLFMICILFS